MGRYVIIRIINQSISLTSTYMTVNTISVRTILEALISFLPTEGAGAIGALDWTPEERKRLAKEVSNSISCFIFNFPSFIHL